MSQDPEPATGPPRTGDREIDDALAHVQQLDDVPVADHHDVLVPAHERLQQALHRDHSRPLDDSR